ncbi:hypothetical protein K493DRAFT_355520 [Basidiobolus meristosporus CBS 931.73]|uniref:Extracellular membrane protein CFEM domain-containing protein n=1 Tax=Basidiobolus meristosporus CBS 931.73 TaxID=1314790 RepID=A0A1Y1Y0K9_9FUNG|nr:hypothetical protein K493DRAFT_355520 [Basidiobolus meristosporus CBS 931.73]|eukprot:ORX91508.1 hypothetical protein K493DRAFT_355520 [Basidiobolus meristosporus CBS 931.73]
MKYTYIALLLTLVLMAVQEVKAACNAQVTFDACIERGKQYFSLCSETDWACKCQRQKDIMNCYNLCLEDAVVQAQAEIQKTVVNANCIQATTSTSTRLPTVTSALSSQPASTGTPSATNAPAPNSANQKTTFPAGIWIAAIASVFLGNRN